MRAIVEGKQMELLTPALPPQWLFGIEQKFSKSSASQDKEAFNPSKNSLSRAGI